MLGARINTLNDLQKLLVILNWVRHVIGISTEDLHSHSKLSEGDPDLLSTQHLTPTATTALHTHHKNDIRQHIKEDWIILSVSLLLTLLFNPTDC